MHVLCVFAMDQPCRKHMYVGAGLMMQTVSDDMVLAVVGILGLSCVACIAQNRTGKTLATVLFRADMID